MKPLIGLLGVVIAAISAEINDQVSSVALPDISGGLSLSHDPGTWFGSLYLTAEVMGMALSPWLLVTFTLRHFTLFVLLLNALSSTLIPFCHAESALFLARAAQGFSGGLTIPLLMTTALRVLEPKIKLYGLSVYSLTATFTPGLAAPLAAFWESKVGWQFVFIEAVPLCTVAAVLVWYGIPQDEPKYERLPKFDWRGALLVLVGFGSLSTMLQQGDRLDWFNSPTICVLALASVVGIPLLLVNEWFHPLPLLKLQLLARRNIAFGFVSLFAFIIISQTATVIPDTLLQDVQGYRPEQFFPISLAFAAGQIVFLPAVAFLLDYPQVDARVVNFIGLGCVLAACIGSSLVTVDWFPGQFYLWLGLQTVGQPMVVMSLLLLATNAVQGPDEAPFASALVNTPRAVAEAVGVWLIQLIQRWRGGLHYNRIVDQIGQDRWQPINSPQLIPDLSAVVRVQAQVLTIADTFLVMAGLTAALMLVVLVLPERTLPPRILAMKK